MKQKLFVLSMDAMVGEDIEYLKTKPNFSKIMEHCCQIEKVQTVYPSITYPAHTSMITGCRPAKHGIYNNTVFRTKANYADWYIERSNIKVETLFDSAKRAGCSTACVYWPIQGNSESIDYNINEYFFYRERSVKAPLTPEVIIEDFRQMGANDATVEAIKDNLDRFPKNVDNRVGKLQKDQLFDDFIMGCTCSLIKRYQPDFLAVHNCMMDSERHKNGIFNEFVNEGLDITDEWLGEVVEAMKEAGVYEDTNFVIISDHGQRNFVRRVKPNVLLARAGYVKALENGKSADDWRAYAQSNGMSASIHVRNKEDEQEVYDYLCKLRDEQVWGFSKVFTKKEVEEQYGWSGPFSFVIETDDYTTFSEDCREPLIANADYSDYRLGKATHGYQPEKGPQPVFVARGPAFKKDFKIPFAYTIDEAPTFARILGDSMPQAEGRVIEEILA